METKWIAIMVIGVMVSLSLGISIKNISRDQLKIEAVSAGLEECPNPDSYKGLHTIWVKDCNSFTETYYEIKDKK